MTTPGSPAESSPAAPVAAAPPLSPEARQRRRVMGMALMAAGLLPFFGMMAYIVAIRHPSPLVIVLTLSCWGVFFWGKTMLKNADLSAYR